MRHLPLLLLLTLAGATSAWAEPARSGATRPLNLSLPRDVLYTTPPVDATDPVRRNLEAPAAGVAPPLPYGSGYESRHRAEPTRLPPAAAGTGGPSMTPPAAPGRSRR